MGSLAVSPVFVGAIDQGTTSSRFLIFNEQGEPVASHQLEFTQHYPHPGKVSVGPHDPLEIVESVLTCIDGAVESFEKQGHHRSAITTIGITNQRETTVVWDRVTGEPLHNAIVWTDTRSQALVREIKVGLGASEVQPIWGIPLSTYPSVSKLLWLLEHVPAVKAAYDSGTLCFGTVDTWLVYRLNGGPKADVRVTDPSNASRTMFMNLETLEYDPRLFDFFRVDPSKLHLPRIVHSADPTAFGRLADSVLTGTTITGCLGDQSAALVGQKGFYPGMAKNTYGTGCFLLYNIGPKPVVSTHGLMTTVAFDFSGADSGMQPMYALEGSIAVAGSSIKFLADNFGFIQSSKEISALAETVEDNGGCTFVTAFSGLFAPYWIDDAQGTIFGITAYTQRGHVARATLEATCFQTKAILDAMEKDGGHVLRELAVDGGMCNSDLTMQTPADISGIPVHRPAMRETTALGAAIAAGFATGVWKSFDSLARVNTQGSTKFHAHTDAPTRDQRFARWQKAVEMSRGWTS
ncbi:glycerol kinase [Grosmannia clavigera kw1407]|uniref:glycerol kinase n=1 Tax=Grosmannia clavigera (strain kw1407 / UAMH 11150) TaxID=655863 RepID=F0XH87_GROCL|nr:glycerol kinase [Grosmannia clavigera kw1407]EFX02948.1 glycerol kinase [Grosmannia clavigera kw1407]